MKKFLPTTICIAFIAMLCLGLSAQTERCAPNGKVQSQFYLNDGSYDDAFRGPTSDVILTSKTSPYPAYKGTVANPFGSQIGTSGGSVQCLEYINGVLYGVRYASGNQFGTFNPTNGAFTVIKTGFHTQGSDGASMAYNPVDGKTYVFPWTGEDSMGARFGTVDLATGNFTTIATWALDGQKTYYAAIDEDGTCYAVRNLSNQFGTIDLATGNFTVKATLTGITSINYIQDLCFDRETGDLYWVGQADYNSTLGYGYDKYYKINKTTGALTILGPTSILSQAFRILTWFPQPCPVVTGVTATIFEKNKVEVKWEAPEVTTNLAHYKIYQNDEEKATVHKDTTEWISEVLADGTYTFEVVAMYSNGCIPEKVAATPIEIKTCGAKAEVLDVIYAPNCSKATITWDDFVDFVTYYNVYRDSVKIADTIGGYIFEDLTFDPTLPHTWSVAFVCPNEVEGEWVSVAKEVCEVIHCEPVTFLKVSYEEDTKEIALTWGAPENLTPEKYQIYKDGEPMGDPITETEYKEDISELAPGDYEFEYCVAPVYDPDVCLEDNNLKVCDEVSFTIVGIKNYTSTFSIVPNPATNKISISAPNNFNTVEILSFLGQVVFTQINAGNTSTLDISNLTDGIYFVRIISENGTSVKKFVKK